jgi:acyl carrier protein
MSQAASSPGASLAAVRGLIAEIMGISPDKVAGCAALVADLGATSLDSSEIVMAIEDEFGIEISDDRAASVVTVDDLDALVLQLTKQASVDA